MQKASFYRELKELNQYLYKHPNNDFKEWIFKDSYADNTGVFVSIFQKDDKTIFAVKGTDVNYSSTQRIKDSLNDTIKSDIAIYLHQIPAQYRPVEQYFNKIKNNYPNIIFTGYSLGGSIVQMLGTKYGNETITFEAIGTATICEPKYTNNIINFGNTLDIAFVSKIGAQIGEIYVMPITKNQEYYPNGIPNLYFHMYKTYGDPAKAEKYKPIRNRVKDYLKNGIIPTIQNRIDNLNQPK